MRSDAIVNIINMFDLHLGGYNFVLLIYLLMSMVVLTGMILWLHIFNQINHYILLFSYFVSCQISMD